jgi:hypothetical protein
VHCLIISLVNFSGRLLETNVLIVPNYSDYKSFVLTAGFIVMYQAVCCCIQVPPIAVVYLYSCSDDFIECARYSCFQQEKS